MCDTVGKIINDKYAIFGKNSDRAVNEPQVVEFYEAKNHKNDEMIKCTYIEIPQVSHTYSIVLSRPTWIWGGEIGVNEFGVCIGNEAVFTKGKYGDESLIGMDLLRLALERSKTADEALNTIISLVQKYGQGGNCGFDTKFMYNNSFLIMDRKEIYVLETVGKDYTYKKETHTSISNCLSIGLDGTYYKNPKTNFKSKYSDPIMTFGACGKKRRELTLNHKLDNVEDMIDLLSTHEPNALVFKNGSVSSVCMHASNSLTADQTTMSMIVELKEDDMVIWLTGSSLPCISLFKPALFKQNGLIFNHEEGNDKYWLEHEKNNRRLISAIITDDIYSKRKESQQAILKIANEGLTDDAIKEINNIDNNYFEYFKQKEFGYEKSSLIYKKFWSKKNQNL